jgi:hypothetical protein
MNTTSPMSCHNCNSGDIRKLSLLYESGVSFIDSKMTGFVVGTGIGVGVGRNRGTQTNALSVRIAPPQAKKYRAAVVWAIVLFFLGGTWHWLWIPTVGCVIVAFQASKWNREQLPRLQQQWASSFMCSRCGWIGIPQPAVSGRPVVQTMIEEPQSTAMPRGNIPLPPAPKAIGETKECPYCLSEIPAAARVCRFCQRDVDSST